MNIDLSQYSFDTIAVNIIVAWLIQRMKLSNLSIFNWMSAATPKINVLVSVTLASLTAAGMAVNWQDGGQTHTLMISGISWVNCFLFVWYVIKNVAFQHGAYKMMFQPLTQGETTALRKSIPVPPKESGGTVEGTS